MIERFTFTERLDEHEEIPIGGGLHLKATRFGDWSNPLLIFAHGQGGSEYSPLMYFGARLHLPEFSTLAINFYSNGPDTRNFKDTTVQQQADDFDAVVKFARERGAMHIQAIGHSLGGLAILRSTAQIEGAALWDPSHFGAKYHLDERDIQNLPHENMLDAGVFFTDGPGYMLPHTLREEARQNGAIDDAQLTKKEYPLLFITAEKSALRPYVRQYYEASSEGYKEFKTIRGASHSFLDSDKIRNTLFNRTLIWCNYVLAQS